MKSASHRANLPSSHLKSFQVYSEAQAESWAVASGLSSRQRSWPSKLLGSSGPQHSKAEEAVLVAEEAVRWFTNSIQQIRHGIALATRLQEEISSLG